MMAFPDLAAGVWGPRFSFLLFSYSFRLKKKCGSFLKSLLNLLQYCICFMVLVSWHEPCGILVPQPGIEPALPALEDEVSTAGLPGKSHLLFSYSGLHCLLG